MTGTIQADVAILGGGMAGVAAALSAARMGSNVVLVERGGFLGGAATAGAVSQFVGWHTKARRKVIHGVADEIVAATRQLGGAADFDWFVMSTGHVMDRLAYDPDILKIALDGMMRDAGVRVLFHAMLCGVRKSGTQIGAMSVATTGGVVDIEAQTYLDTSGDMALLSAAGAEFLPEPDRGRQPATMMFAMAPVDFERLDAVSRDDKAKIIALGLKAGDLPRAALHHSRVPGSDVAWFNISRVSMDATDPFSLSEGEMEGRAQALRISRFLRANLPGCENAQLAKIAPALGIRDTRRVQGEHVLTADDLRQGDTFADTIACGAYPIDIHHADGAALTIEDFGEDHFYRIPYRSLIPKGLSNLATAGRGLSAEADAFAAVRVMPAAMATGQAAGVAASLVTRGNSRDFRDVPVQGLQVALRDQRAFLGDA